MKFVVKAIIQVGLFASLSGDAQAENDKPIKPVTRESLDSALAADLELMDRRVAKIRDFTADFEERKTTAILKKPLVSQGKVKVTGTGSRWDTISPHPSTLVLNADRIRIYYPRRSTLEEYSLDEKLKWLALSPLPKLADLIGRFTIERIPVADLVMGDSNSTYMGLRLTPRDATIGEYLYHVDVVLNTTAAHMVRVEIADADGDRTVISFSNVRMNTGLEEKDIELLVPEGTQIVRPLAGLEKKSPEAPP